MKLKHVHHWTFDKLICAISIICLAVVLVLVLVLKDFLRTYFKSLSLSWSLGSGPCPCPWGVRSRRSLSWSLEVRSFSFSCSFEVRSLSLSWSLGVRSLSWSLRVRSLLTSLSKTSKYFGVIAIARGAVHKVPTAPRQKS